MDNSTPPAQPEAKHSNAKGWIILAGILVVCAIVSGTLLLPGQNREYPMHEAGVESTSTTLTYTNQHYHYSLDYPSDFKLTVVDDGAALSLRAPDRSQVFTLSTSSDQPDIQDCLSVPDQPGESPLSTTTINDKTFAHYRYDAPGASGFDDVFHTLYGGACYFLDAVYLTKTPGNSIADDITRSFRFLQ